MLVISSVIVGLWTALMLAASVRVSNYEDGDSISPFHLSRHELIIPAILGAAVGLSNFMAPKGGAAAASCLVAMLIVFAYLVYFYRHCKAWKEVAMCIFTIIPINVIFMFVVAAVAETTPVLMNFAWIPFIIVIGVALTSLIVSKYESVDNEKSQKVYGILRFVVPAIAILLALNSLAKTFNFGKEAVVEETQAAAETVTEEVIDSKEQQWWHFYNTELLKDDDPKNDYNFGPNPLEKLATDKVASGELKLKDIANKTEDELIGLVSVEDVETDFRSSVKNDPARGAGDMAYCDSLTKTRYLGTFYDECKGNWASTINLAKERWMKDMDAYWNTLAAWFTFLDTAEKVELVKETGGLDDQMYMNPYTTDLVPDVIVMETTDHDGYFLRYTFNIKGEEIKVAYRVNCGYQPTNVSKVMNIKAQKNPNKKEEPKPVAKKQETPSGGKSVTTPKNTTPVSAPVLPPMFTPDVNPNITPGPTPGPDPDITNPKDPTKGTDVGDNNTSGPGSNTNNGEGARYSTEDDSTKSSHMTEVKAEKAEAELKDEPKVMGDSNEPSTKVEKDVAVDANADKGTGNGGIDDNIQAKDYARVESNLGGNDSVEDDYSITEWKISQD